MNNDEARYVDNTRACAEIYMVFLYIFVYETKHVRALALCREKRDTET